MTREEAIALLNEQYETCKRIYDCSADQRKSYPNVPQFMEALGMALSSLRPVSREQVEKVWKGGQEKDVTMRYICKLCGCVTIEEIDFCPYCGAAQTDKAVDIIMKRLEALNDETD